MRRPLLAGPDSLHDPPRDAVADDEGNVVIWGEHVTDDEYAAAPALDR